MTVDALVAAADGKKKAGERALEAGEYSVLLVYATLSY
jgi:hypothetical protein